jgi:citrate synthase
MTMADNQWASAVTSIAPNEIRVRGYRLDELMGRVSFGEAVYLVLRGELPGAAVGRVMEAMLVASIDHGVTPPSTLSARNAATDQRTPERLHRGGCLGGQPAPRRGGRGLHSAPCARTLSGRRR